MPRHANPSELTINLKSANDTAQASSGPNTSPINVDLSSFGGDFGGTTQNSSLPPLPSSPPTSPRHSKDPSKNLLSNFKTRLAPEQDRVRNHNRPAKEEDEGHRPDSSSVSKIYHLRKNPGSTPELSLVGSADSVGKAQADADNTAQPNGRPQHSPQNSEESSNSRRREKPFRNPLARSKSIRRDSHSKTRPEMKNSNEQPPKTAPIGGDWTGGEMGLLKAAQGTDKRGKSAERAPYHQNHNSLSDVKTVQPKKKEKERSDGGGFMSGSKNVVSKATKGGGNLFTRLGKIGRSSSANEKDIPDSEYVLRIINLPLVEQTRVTRISKDLNSCRDKTEYWMPALPWRAIDYLNLNCESEGLYRVPGGFAQIKHWQRRFDTELDIDLLDEKDLYDPNEIGSMLKKWLTDLPTEMMPSSIQSSLAVELEKDNPDFKLVGQSAPQKLRDALSELSPFNYYLLFAVTCHLSLLLSNKDKNKMDLHNLSVCIGPCLKLERWLFNYLVGDWRHCWQGCFTEKQFLEAERAYEQGGSYEPPAGQSRSELSSPNHSMLNLVGDERAVHSSGSSKPDSRHGDAPQDQDMQKSRKENRKPDTYRPAGHGENGGGSAGRVAALDLQRPATSEGKEGDEGSSSKTSTPRQFSHGRSKSDAATTPVKTTYGSDHPFALPTRP